MKKGVTAIALFFSICLLHAGAAADKYGIDAAMSDSGGGSGRGFVYLSVWCFIGGLVGYLYAKSEQAKGKPVATDGGIILGVLLAFFASPLMLFLL